MLPAQRSLRHARRPGGFTLLELMVVVAIIGVLVGILLPALARARAKTRESSARNAMQAVCIGLEKYREDWGSYPPDNTKANPPVAVSGDAAGTEVLGWCLCMRHKWGDMHYGPYLDNLGSGRVRDEDGDECLELVSPLNGYYRYALLVDREDSKKRRYLVVDAGLDGLWGGTIDAEVGFVPDGSKNKDGAAADQDNIYSSSIK